VEIESGPDLWGAEKWRECERWHGLYDGSPISVAWNAWNAAGEVLSDATEYLKMRPTTLAGMEALLSYVGEFPDDESWTNEEEEIDFLKEVMVAAADSARTLAGAPESTFALGEYERGSSFLSLPGRH